MPPHLVELMGLEVVQVPIDTTGAAVSSDWLSLKNYAHATIVIMQGAWAGGTPAVTLAQGKDIAGLDEKALAFTKRWDKVAVTGTTFVEQAVTSNTFNLPATANTINVIDVEAAELDTDGGFDCIQAEVASPGSNADLLCILVILSGARYPQKVMSDAKVN